MKVLAAVRHALHILLTPVRWVREGQDDLDGTYPDHRKATGAEAATSGSVVTSLTGLGQG